mmetsp:Transcript_43682/g.81686  ORF Transcript_43682/g.81686 Transcript_43682/m.81686 type:complete len:476 (+) Transcript_43682:126-1553(+)
MPTRWLLAAGASSAQMVEMPAYQLLAEKDTRSGKAHPSTSNAANQPYTSFEFWYPLKLLPTPTTQNFDRFKDCQRISMCGRARCTLGESELSSAASTSPNQWVDMQTYQPSYNVAPGTCLPVVICHPSTGNNIHSMTWGLIPSYTKHDSKVDHWRMFNARSEDLQDRPAFRRLLRGGRCIVLVDGFFEWASEGGLKQPYLVSLQPQNPNSNNNNNNNNSKRIRVMHLAGLYDSWHQPDGRVLNSFAILTTDVSPKLRWLHNRMPVVLSSEQARLQWLEPKTEVSAKTFAGLFEPYNGDDVVWWPVSSRMNKLGVDGPECCQEVARAVKQHAGDIGALFKRRACQSFSENAPQADSMKGCIAAKRGLVDELDVAKQADNSNSCMIDPAIRVRTDTGWALDKCESQKKHTPRHPTTSPDQGNGSKRVSTGTSNFSSKRSKRSSTQSPGKQSSLLSFFNAKPPKCSGNSSKKHSDIKT